MNEYQVTALMIAVTVSEFCHCAFYLLDAAVICGARCFRYIFLLIYVNIMIAQCQNFLYLDNLHITRDE